MGITYDDAAEIACIVLGAVLVLSVTVGLVVRRRRRKADEARRQKEL